MWSVYCIVCPPHNVPFNWWVKFIYVECSYWYMRTYYSHSAFYSQVALCFYFLVFLSSVFLWLFSKVFYFYVTYLSSTFLFFGYYYVPFLKKKFQTSKVLILLIASSFTSGSFVLFHLFLCFFVTNYPVFGLCLIPNYRNYNIFF